MSPETKVYDAKMQKTIEVVKANFASVRAGRANAGVLDRIFVEYYGTPTPLNQVAAISSPDPRTLMIQPWDGTLLKAIEKAIQTSDLGINPQNDGVPEIGGKQQAADLLHQLDDRPAVRQAQAAAIQGGGALRQGAAYGRGGFLDVLGIHKQASFPCVEKSKRQRMRHASSAAAFTRFSRAIQSRAIWANHA